MSKANLLTEAGILLSCAAASAFAILEAPSAPALAGAPASASSSIIRPDVARETWSKVAASHFDGAKFEIADHKVM